MLTCCFTGLTSVALIPRTDVPNQDPYPASTFIKERTVECKDYKPDLGSDSMQKLHSNGPIANQVPQAGVSVCRMRTRVWVGNVRRKHEIVPDSRLRKRGSSEMKRSLYDLLCFLVVYKTTPPQIYRLKTHCRHQSPLGNALLNNNKKPEIQC